MAGGSAACVPGVATTARPQTIHLRPRQCPTHPPVLDSHDLYRAGFYASAFATTSDRNLDMPVEHPFGPHAPPTYHGSGQTATICAESRPSERPLVPGLRCDTFFASPRRPRYRSP